MRVVSLLPSATDTLVALNLTHLLVGRSHECDAAGTAALPVCSESKLGDLRGWSSEEVDAAAGASGAALWHLAAAGGNAAALLEWGLGVFRTRLPALAALRPTHVLTQVQEAGAAAGQGGGAGEEEVAAAQAALSKLLGYEVTVLQLQADSLDAVLADCCRLAAALGAPEGGAILAARTRLRLSAVAEAAQRRPPVRCAVLQWAAPAYAAGAWVPQLLRLAGGLDVLSHTTGRALHPGELAAANPQLLIMALCGEDRAAAAAAGAALDAPCAVLAVDARRLYSRGDPGLLADTAEALLALLHSTASAQCAGAAELVAA